MKTSSFWAFMIWTLTCGYMSCLKDILGFVSVNFVILHVIVSCANYAYLDQKLFKKKHLSLKLLGSIVGIVLGLCLKIFFFDRSDLHPKWLQLLICFTMKYFYIEYTSNFKEKLKCENFCKINHFFMWNLPTMWYFLFFIIFYHYAENPNAKYCKFSKWANINQMSILPLSHNFQIKNLLVFSHIIQ